MPGTPRPVRERCMPARLADFVVDMPQSLQFRKTDRHMQNQLNRIATNKVKAEELMVNNGSKTVLRDCLKRIDESHRDVQECIHNATQMITEEDQLSVEDMADDVQHIVESTVDAINEHLEGRDDEPTVNTASRMVRHIASSTPFRRDITTGEPGPSGYKPPGQEQQDSHTQQPTHVSHVEDEDDPDYVPEEEYADDDIDDDVTTDARSINSNLDISHQIVNTLAKIAAQADLQLPSFIFDGSPWMYPRFVQDFERRVGSKPLTTSTKMHHLVKATIGKAHECIEVYQGMKGGYQKARLLLKERYGQPYQIVQSCISRLTSTSRLRGNDTDAINRFADRLRSDYDLLNEMTMLAEANTQTTIKAVFDQLPPGMQSRWITELQKLHPRQPIFKDIVDFVTAESKRNSHPVYQVASAYTAPDRPRRPTRNQEHGGARPRPPRDDYRASTFSHQTRDSPADRRSHPAVPQSPQMSPSAASNSSSRANPTQRPPRRDWSSTDSREPNQYQARLPGQGQGHQPTADKCVFCSRIGHKIICCPLFELQDDTSRRRFAQDKHLCYTCLAIDHMTSSCAHKNRECAIRGCSGKHHKLLHQTRQREPHTSANEPTQNWRETTGSIQSSCTSTPRVLLRVVPVRVRGRDGTSLTTFGLVDGGSTTTLMARELSVMLNIQGRPRQVSHDTIFNSDQCINVDIANCELSPLPGLSRDDEAIFRINGLEVVPELHIDERYTPDNFDLSKWDHLRDLCIHVTVDVPRICLLIGQDNPATQRIFDTRYGTDVARQPYAVLTPFGWTVAGPTRPRLPPNDVISYVAKSSHIVAAATPLCCPDDSDDVKSQLARIEHAVNKFWNEEKHGFSNDDSKTLSQEDKIALQILETKTMQDHDGHYVVPMLWRNVNVQFPNNYSVARRCLNHVVKRFSDDPQFEVMYRKSLRDYIQKGYAIKLSSDAAQIHTPRTWYLTHHGVQNPNKPGKVRVVKNAALEVGGISLNKMLYHGPDINNTLVGVLLRFRIGAVAFNADIAEMFHRVKVSDEDSEALRFLWWDDDESTKDPPSTFKMLRHIFGATDSPTACVFALQQCARDNTPEFDAETIRTVLTNFYVDDVLKSVSSIDRAIFLARELIALLSRGGFCLTKFVSNRAEVLSALPPDSIAPACREVMVDLEELPVQRALGVKWDTHFDTFGIKISMLERPSTRRGCLSFTCAITDTFGMICPVTLVAKQILQETCRRNLGWDDLLPLDLLTKWEKWKASLSVLKDFTLPRCIAGMEDATAVKNVQLHNFSDASERGYGTASYIRVESKNGVNVSLVMAKSRTAPLKFMSIPRSEFQAATVSSRVSKMIHRELDIAVDSTYYWTDSTIAIHYIRNTDRRFKTFIANRKEEIVDASDPKDWRFCPTKLNPADIASRGVLGHQLMKNQLWLEGPPFLKLPSTMWPINVEDEQLPDDDPEVKQHSVIASVTEPESTMSTFIRRYSDWDRLLTSLVWLNKFVQYLIAKTLGKPFPDAKICAADLDTAVEIVVRVAQRECHLDELQSLRNALPVKLTSTLRALRPVLVNDSLRVGGRLAEAPLSFDTRHPLIVPKEHHVVQLIIRHYHIIAAHAGPAHTLALIREKFWIPNAKNLVKRLCRSCIVCKKLHARTMTQVMANLPVSRLTPYEPPFTETGIDCFGPLLVKRGRSTVKRYGMIATCFAVRAVHLELLDSLNTDDFINGLRRFISRRGTPRTIWCDNGTNFVGGSRELRRSLDEWNQKQIERFLLQSHINWKFQPPTASHMSGVWERLVKSVKLSLKATLANTLVSDDVLRTVLIEVESVLNSRPLTASSDDPRDFEALTPNHFLLQRRVDNLPPGLFVKDDIYRRSWRVVQYLANHSWKRWIREYVPNLLALSKWRRPVRDVKVGDLVLLSEANLQRSQWSLGRIVQVSHGRDGRVRVADVKTKTGIYTRPIHSMCLLEGAGAD